MRNDLMCTIKNLNKNKKTLIDILSKEVLFCIENKCDDEEKIEHLLDDILIVCDIKEGKDLFDKLIDYYNSINHTSVLIYKRLYECFYNNKKDFFEILTSDNIENDINDNIDYILQLIPELSIMFNYDQKNDQHHLPLWEHTLYAMSLSKCDFETRLVLLLHDIGKPYVCQEVNGTNHYKGHPDKSCEIAQKILDRFGYDEDYKNEILYLIKFHDTPINEIDIEKDYELALKRYEIQKCDALAHNPKYLDKRKEYLERTYILLKK